MKATCLSTLVVGLALGLTGCANNNSTYSDTPKNASVHIEAASRDLLVGDTATFIARTQDTYGRDAKVAWSSTAGTLTTQDDGRVARVKFTEVGTYSVKATLSVDGKEVQTDLVEVRVKPLN
ncbi:MAG: hypothetical protein H7210_05715 [Pyrinomonadaceae bacterium]|nr:hypothetical protein [Phycisphaerales bacterium]